MQPYREFQPTGFDPKGAFLEDERQDWLVLPTGRNRDSGPYSLSNFDTALEMLGGESETVEVHRFGHWGPGWYEIIIVKPDTPAHDKALEIERSLKDYPILDEEDCWEREWTGATECWANQTTIAERVDLCQKAGVSVFAARHGYIPEDDDGTIFQACRPE
jgi:hypothetical protein